MSPSDSPDAPDTGESASPDESRTDSDEPSTDSESGFVYCRSCGAKAPTAWAFCRSCQSPLDDAVSPEQKQELSGELYPDQSDVDGEYGCQKCGQTEVDVEIVETTGIAVTPRIAAQNDRFRIVSCTHCGYCEFYRGGDPDILVDLFLR